jgi:RHS repeat-associated protein
VGTTGAGGTLTSANGTADEYGNPRDTATIGARRYGWLRQATRRRHPGGLTLMGVRLYNPTTGRFLSTDPIPGGNANPYEYCSADPINCTDLDGRIGWKKFFKRHRGALATIGATAGCMVPGVGWASCGALQAAAWGVRSQQRASQGGGWRRTWRASARDGIYSAASFGLGSALRSLKYAGCARSRFVSSRSHTSSWKSLDQTRARRWTIKVGGFTGYGSAYGAYRATSCRYGPRSCN